MTADFLATRAGWGHDSDAPIFVVGVQRSGSTLVEQILASHNSIEGTSELPIMAQILRDVAGSTEQSTVERLAMLDREQVRQLGQGYLDRAAAFRHTDKPRFVDKHPGNWSNIGLDPADPAQRQNHRRPAPPAGDRLVQFQTGLRQQRFLLLRSGDDWPIFSPLSAHGRPISSRLPAMQSTASVNETADRRISNRRCARCSTMSGSSHDPACLQFHRTARAVRTPSAAQVRHPINRDGVDRWRAFEPMLDAADPGTWDRRWTDGMRPPGAYRDEGSVNRCSIGKTWTSAPSERSAHYDGDARGSARIRPQI